MQIREIFYCTNRSANQSAFRKLNSQALLQEILCDRGAPWKNEREKGEISCCCAEQKFVEIFLAQLNKYFTTEY